MDKDLYAVLGVAHDAESCVIRAAYRALCQQHHPDKMASAAHARMTELNEAYGVLGDEEKRKTYDARRRAPVVASLGARTIGLRCLIIAGSLVVADLVATEEKSWWRWGWDVATSCGADSSHHVVHWPVSMGVVALGLAGAWRVGRRARHDHRCE
jgi:hypothetical protein